MVVYTLQENTFIVEAYFRTGFFRNGEWKFDVNDCMAFYREKFPQRKVQDRTLYHHILRTIHKFRKTGSVLKIKSTGRPRISIDNMCTIRIVCNVTGNSKTIKKNE